jgi:hypothetical protein
MPETPEAGALVLLEKIWKAENWDRQGPDGTHTPIHRKTILDTYAECLAVVREPKKPIEMGDPFNA